MKNSKRDLDKNKKYFYPLAHPTYNYQEVMQSINSMVNFKTSMHEKVKYFEKLFGEKYGGEAIMVNSGSSADLLISYALLEKLKGSFQPGSEIIIPAVTWPTHLWSPIMAGFNVKLVDIDPTTLNFNLDEVISNITEKTKAIFVVHLLGNTGKIKELVDLCQERDIILLEDCCEALGSKFNDQYFGTFGLASSFSFFFSHHLVTMEGGMILTRDKSFAQSCRLLRSHGWAREISTYQNQTAVPFQEKYRFITWGFNVRPTELQAGFGIEQIKKIDDFQLQRTRNGEILTSFIKKYKDFISTMRINDGITCSWFAFPILINHSSPFSRDQFTSHLEKFGIETRPIVAGNLARQPALKKFTNISYGSLSGADYVNDYGFYIGIHPTTKIKDLKKVIQVMDDYLMNWIVNA